MERYYSTHSGLLVDMGNPDYPGTRPDGTDVPWISITTSSPIPDTAFFLAERYTINSVTSAWNVYAVATEELGFGLIPYTITGRNKPALNSTQWNDDAIVAVSAYTGQAYSTIKELGYGTTVVITYDDGKLYGMLKKVGGVATWVAPINYIDGALLVDTSIIEDKIADNAITVNKILNNSINSDKIAANAVNTSEIAVGAITANEIQADAVNANHIAANAVTADAIAANSVTASEIAAGAVTASEIATGTITANEMSAGSVTTTVLAANAVSADKIQANAITSGKLVVTGTGAITPSTISAASQADLDTTNANVTQAISDAAGAQSTADGKINTYYQTTAPTGMVASDVGDLWIDTDDGNKQYRYSGSSWVDVQDTGIGTAISDAAGAQSTADGKVTTFYQTTAPTAEGTGDLWVDTDDGNKLYRWSGTAWVDVQDTSIADAQTTADTANTNALARPLPSEVADAINNNTTTINGSKITTGTISASSITTGYLSANRVAAGIIYDDSHYIFSGGEIVGENSASTYVMKIDLTNGSIHIK